jgi:deazaflavin-dependent oxidoreductase (nitroreductase family)
MSNQPKLPDWIEAHIKLYLEDPEKGHMWDSGALGGPGMLQTLLLTSTGRKSGEPRLLPLIYKKVGDNYIIIASKGGAPAHPSWFLNLEANPDCHIQVKADHFDARMRIAQGAEREDLWDQLAEQYAPYNDYKKTAGDRVIPVVVLEPKS